MSLLEHAIQREKRLTINNDFQEVAYTSRAPALAALEPVTHRSRRDDRSILFPDRARMVDLHPPGGISRRIASARCTLVSWLRRATSQSSSGVMMPMRSKLSE